MSTTETTGCTRRRALARISRAFLIGVSLIVAAPLATEAAGQSSPSSSDKQLEIRDAWIRWLPSGLPAAGYMTLINHAAQPVTLSSVSSDAYRDIGLHQSTTHEGMSHMQAVSAISVPAHSSLSFAAGGYHLMLMQPTRALAPGDHVALTLHFGGGVERTASFEVRAPNAGAPAHDDMNGMHGMSDMPGMHSTPSQPPR
jgi:copper(I)-binding protein